jgi:hypothetical protein
MRMVSVREREEDIITGGGDEKCTVKVFTTTVYFGDATLLLSLSPSLWLHRVNQKEYTPSLTP